MIYLIIIIGLLYLFFKINNSFQISYAKFEKINDNLYNDLQQNFMSDIKKYSETSQQFALLFNILLNTDKKLKINQQFYSMINQKRKIYIVMLNSNNDSILLELAKKYNFPRGCPIIWIPGELIKFNGFYCKFKNDEGVGSNFINDFEEINKNYPGSIITGINMNEKISGFLCHIIGFKIDNKYYWTLCSKKSADSLNSPYIKMGYEIINKYITFKLVKQLAEGLYLGCEVLHPEDNTHGYVSKTKTFIITCVAYGFSNINYNDNKPLMSYNNENEMYLFCINNKLPCGTQYSFTGNNKNYLGLLELIFIERDLMTATSITERLPEIINWAKENDINFIKKTGLINHEKDINEIMEGCIVFITYITPTGEIKKKIFKAKFGYYVINTMFFRKNIECIFKGLPLHNAESFVKFWITSKYYNYFIELCNTGMKYIENIKLEENEVYHIKMGNYARSIVPISVTNSNLNKRIKKIVCIIGPIGSGKTSYMKELVKQIPNSKAIDGDQVLFLNDENITYKLSTLRTPTTMSLIYQTLTEGKIPIISFGGGQFLGGKDQTIEVLKWLYDVFGYDIDFKFEIFYCTSKVKTFTSCLKEDFINYIDSGSNIKEIVHNRLLRNEWKLEGKKENELVQEIIKRSNDNATKVAPKYLSLIRTKVYLLPSITIPEDVIKYLNPNIKEIISLLECDNEPLIFTAKRVYAIFKVDNMYLHATQYFGDGINILPKCNLLIGDKLNGNIYSTQFQCDPPLKNPKVCKVIDFNTELLETIRKSHITITMCGLPNKDSLEIIKNWNNLDSLVLKQIDKNKIINYNHISGKDIITPTEIIFCGVIALGHYEG